MAYKTITLGCAVQNTLSREPKAYYLPAMQRPYVWEKSDAKELFCSIYKRFPIGTTLLWKTTVNGNYKLGANRIYEIPSEKKKFNTLHNLNLPEGQEIIFVLDGQQRLTTLKIALTGFWENSVNKKEIMFFNMDIEPSECNKDTFPIEETKPGNNYIPCHDILRWKSKKEFDEYLIEKHITENNIWHKNIIKLYERFWNDDAFCYGECNADSMGEAVDIFVISNSSGKKLEMTDLIMAYLSTSWDNIDAKYEVKELITQLNKKFSKSVPFNTKSILKIFLCVSKDSNGKLLTSSMSTLLKSLNAELIRELENQWIGYKKSIEDSCILLERWGIAKAGLLKSTNSLIPIILWLNINNIDINSETKEVINNIEFARRWLLISLANSVYSGQSDNAITDTRKTIIESNSNFFPLTNLMKDSHRHGKHVLSNEQDFYNFIKELEYPDTSKSLSLILFLIRGSFYKGLDRDTVYHLDHIFSKSDNKNIDTINSIGNIQLLPNRDNQKKGNRHPKMFWNSGSYDENFLKINILPIDPSFGEYDYIYNNPKEFIEQRNKDIADKLISLLS